MRAKVTEELINQLEAAYIKPWTTLFRKVAHDTMLDLKNDLKELGKKVFSYSLASRAAFRHSFTNGFSAATCCGCQVQRSQSLGNEQQCVRHTSRDLMTRSLLLCSTWSGKKGSTVPHKRTARQPINLTAIPDPGMCDVMSSDVIVEHLC